MAQLSQEQMERMATSIQECSRVLGRPIEEIADFCGINRTRFQLYADGALSDITEEEFQRLKDNFDVFDAAYAKDLEATR